MSVQGKTLLTTYHKHLFCLDPPAFIADKGYFNRCMLHSLQIEPDSGVVAHPRRQHVSQYGPAPVGDKHLLKEIVRGHGVA